MIHDAVEAAVHAQPLPAVTETLFAPPDASIDAPDPLRENEHGAGGSGVGAGVGVGVGVGAGGGGTGGGGTGEAGGGTTTGGAAPSAIVTDSPATMTDAVRDAEPPFAATVSVTAPAPFPVFPFVTAIQSACDAAVQLHPARVSTERATVPPSADTVVLAGVTANLHGAASCVTTMETSFTSTFACRGTGSRFAPTV